MKLRSIASGSSGNSIYVGSDTAHILVDAGTSGKKIEAGLNDIDIKASELDGIFVTHEHIDHTKGLGIISRKYGIPIYATRGTIEGIKATSSLGTIDEALFIPIERDKKIFVKDLEIDPVRISHDANEPCAYKIKCEGRGAGIITDLGTYDEYTISCMEGLNVIFAEANHDIRMLEAGPYPYQLKRRILSDRGHLSNENSGRMISRLLNDNITHLILGHLSKENNLPELAYETVRLEIEASDTEYGANDFPLMVAKRDEPGPLIEV